MTTPVLPCCSLISDGMLVHLQVVPRAKKSEVVGLYGTRLKVRVAAPPAEGAANAAVVALLREFTGWKSIELRSGGKSQEKSVVLLGCRETPLPLLKLAEDERL